MIGFQDQDVGGADPLNDQFGGVAEVGEKTDVSPARAQEETDRVVGIMGDAEGIDADIPDLERRSGGEDPAVQLALELLFDGFFGEAIAIDRHPELFRAEDAESLNMIAVFVGDENTMEALGGPSDLGQALPNLASAKAGVDQQPGVVRFEIGAISS